MQNHLLKSKHSIENYSEGKQIIRKHHVICIFFMPRAAQDSNFDLESKYKNIETWARCLI